MGLLGSKEVLIVDETQLGLKTELRIEEYEKYVADVEEKEKQIKEAELSRVYVRAEDRPKETGYNYQLYITIAIVTIILIIIGIIIYFKSDSYNEPTYIIYPDSFKLIYS